MVAPVNPSGSCGHSVQCMPFGPPYVRLDQVEVGTGESPAEGPGGGHCSAFRRRGPGEHAAIRDAGPTWTIVEPQLFDQNFGLPGLEAS